MAIEFMGAVRPGLQIQSGPLSDPMAPTPAETEPEFEALVVSQETIPGALAINEGRERRGYPLLDIIVVGLVGQDDRTGVKLSSTDLRRKEAAAAAG